MGEMHLPTPESASYELALANRKLVTVVMGMTLLMGLVACLAYLAGRSVTGIRATQESQMVVPPPVIVEPSAQMEAPPAVPAPAVDPAAAPSAVVEKETPRTPVVYLQVAAAELPNFQPLRSQLEQAGFPLEVKLIEGKHRLLVGPIEDGVQQQELVARLKAAGHPYFARRL
jgi:hypothetical protein